MRYLTILLLVFLTACSTPVPIVPPFPDVIAGLKETCPNLKKIDESTTKLSEVVEIVTDNYQLYYDCKSKVDDWIEWYTTQKGIFDKIK